MQLHGKYDDELASEEHQVERMKLSSSKCWRDCYKMLSVAVCRVEEEEGWKW